jgi:hypothetical protein
MAVRWCITVFITRCSMTRASPEATEQLLAQYCPGGRQGDNQHNDYAKCTHFSGRFDGHRDAPVLYRAHHPMEEVRGFHKSH